MNKRIRCIVNNTPNVPNRLTDKSDMIEVLANGSKVILLLSSPSGLLTNSHKEPICSNKLPKKPITCIIYFLTNLKIVIIRTRIRGIEKHKPSVTCGKTSNSKMPLTALNA